MGKLGGQKLLTEQQKRILTRGLIERIEKYFENPEVQADYEIWLAERNAKK